MQGSPGIGMQIGGSVGRVVGSGGSEIPSPGGADDDVEGGGVECDVDAPGAECVGVGWDADVDGLTVADPVGVGPAAAPAGGVPALEMPGVSVGVATDGGVEVRAATPLPAATPPPAATGCDGGTIVYVVPDGLGVGLWALGLLVP